MRLREFYLSLEEEQTDGESRPEIEHTFICRLEDFSQLELADNKILQEQYEIRTDDQTKSEGVRGCIRVRAVDGEQFILTTKLYSDDARSCQEASVETTEDMFKHFRTLAPCGSRKLRHVFPVEGTDWKWELDIYFKADGSFEEWCRLEIEVPGLEVELPEYPIRFAEVISQTETQSEENKELMDRLYSEVFIFSSKDSLLPIKQ